MISKLFYRPLVVLFLLVFAAGEAFSQKDSVQVTPKSGDACWFFITVKNRNVAQKPIDQVIFKIISGDGIQFSQLSHPANWSEPRFDPDNLTDTLLSESINAFIQPGGSLAGFDFSILNNEYDKPVAIAYETWYQNSMVSSGTITPICTPFQINDKHDTVTVFTQLSEQDPCFSFTVINRSTSFSPIIYSMRFQLLTASSGTLRPSKIKAPNGWILDSISAFIAYFHTVDHPIDVDQNLGGFQMCLRGNPAATKHDFSWAAMDRENATIDRDTLRNISIQALSGSTATDADTLLASVVGGSGCLYQLAVKNYHVSNTQLPGAITKVILNMQTPSVQFDAAPSAPPHWTKTFTANTITYTAESIQYGIQSGTVSTDFRFSVTGSNNSDFTVAWETWRQALISSGQFTSKCQTVAPRDDEATVTKPIQDEPCKFQLTVANKHNSPPSDLNAITLSIPNGKGVISASSSSLFWNATTVSGTEIKFTSASSPQTTGQSNALVFSLTPTVDGEQIPLTWKSFEDAAATKLVFSSTVNISCTPGAPAKPCDTIELSGTGTSDCIQHFLVRSRNGSSVTKVILTPDNLWLVDQISASPSGWTGTIDPTKQFVTFTNTTGVSDGQTLGGFDVKFIGVGTTPPFHVAAETQNQSSISCTAFIDLACTPTQDVAPRTEGTGLGEIVIVPNPTTSSSELRFVVTSRENVWITVVDELGKTITTAANQIYPDGTYSIPLSMSGQPSGNYYVRIQTSHGVVTKRLVKQ